MLGRNLFMTGRFKPVLTSLNRAWQKLAKPDQSTEGKHYY